jgi:hypothetical protein
MVLREHSTNRRLWLAVSLVLFVIAWLMPLPWGGKESFASYCWGMVTDLWGRRSELGAGELEDAALSFGFFSFLFGVPALVIGWVVQCVIVMVRDRLNRVPCRG